VSLIVTSLGCARNRAATDAAGAAPEPQALALRYTITRRADDSLAVRVRLDLPPARDSVTTLALPSEWAGRRRLWANILDLRAVGPGVTIAPGADSAQRVLRARAGTPLSVEWTLRGTGGPPTDDAHNFSDIAPRWAQLAGHDALVVPAVSRGTPVRDVRVRRTA
jgi:hypothetical protein